MSVEVTGSQLLRIKDVLKKRLAEVEAERAEYRLLESIETQERQTYRTQVAEYDARLKDWESRELQRREARRSQLQKSRKLDELLKLAKRARLGGDCDSAGAGGSEVTANEKHGCLNEGARAAKSSRASSAVRSTGRSKATPRTGFVGASTTVAVAVAVGAGGGVGVGAGVRSMTPTASAGGAGRSGRRGGSGGGGDDDDDGDPKPEPPAAFSSALGTRLKRLKSLRRKLASEVSAVIASMRDAPGPRLCGTGEYCKLGTAQRVQMRVQDRLDEIVETLQSLTEQQKTIRKSFRFGKDEGEDEENLLKKYDDEFCSQLAYCAAELERCSNLLEKYKDEETVQAAVCRFRAAHGLSDAARQTEEQHKKKAEALTASPLRAPSSPSGLVSPSVSAPPSDARCSDVTLRYRIRWPVVFASADPVATYASIPLESIPLGLSPLETAGFQSALSFSHRHDLRNIVRANISLFTMRVTLEMQRIVLAGVRDTFWKDLIVKMRESSSTNDQQRARAEFAHTYRFVYSVLMHQGRSYGAFLPKPLSSSSTSVTPARAPDPQTGDEQHAAAEQVTTGTDDEPASKS
eukprot:ANDGO_04573.mRNA.1 hypothetical protein